MIELLNPLSIDLSELVYKSVEEGYKLVRRLRDDIISGKNRFSKEGEFLLAYIVHKKIVGVCGMNSNGDGRGRLRRLYILPTHRGKGIGKLLVKKCVSRSEGVYSIVVCNAGTPEAGRFYDHLGWETIEEERLTHLWRISYKRERRL